MSVRLLLVALVLAAPSLARAQAGMQDNVETPPHFTLSEGDQKSQKTAFGLSLGLTLGIAGVGVATTILGAVAPGGDKGQNFPVALTGLGIITLGLVFGPSIGHIYEGDYSTAIGFIFARLMGVAVAAGLTGASFVLAFTSSEGDTVGPSWPTYLCLTGAALSILGILVFDGYDIWDATRAGARARSKHEVSLLPVIARVGNSTAYGLGVGAAF